MGSERDEPWFEALFHAHGNHVAAYARRRVPSDTDDIVSEVFTAAWRHREKVPDLALPWLYRTAANVVLHHRRGRARGAALTARIADRDEPDRDPPDAWSGVAGRLDDVRRVERLFSDLPARDIEILRLWAWEQLEPAEIAYVLTVSPAAARVRLHRARTRARALLAADRPHAAGPPPFRHLEEFR